MPQVQTHTFTSPRTPMEAPLVEQLNQFFVDNPSITIVELQANWYSGASRGRALTLTLTFFTGMGPRQPVPNGGVLYYAAEFTSTPSATADAQANAFFAANPSFLPSRTLLLQSRETRYVNAARLLVIYRSVLFISALHTPIALSGISTVDIPPGATAIEADATDYTRARFPSVLNASTQPWLRTGTALVVKGNDGVGNTAFAGIGPNLISPAPPVILPDAPTLPDAPALCDCCYNLTSVGYHYGTAICIHDQHLTFDYEKCYRGTPADVMKAVGSGFVQVFPMSGLGPCICTPYGSKWVWPDPLHYMFNLQTTFENGFWGLVGFEDLSTCADFDYDDSVWILRMERCANTNSSNCLTAPVNPPTPPFLP
jgi:hypothetical protein